MQVGIVPLQYSNFPKTQPNPTQPNPTQLGVGDVQFS